MSGKKTQNQPNVTTPHNLSMKNTRKISGAKHITHNNASITAIKTPAKNPVPTFFNTFNFIDTTPNFYNTQSEWFTKLN